MTPKPNDLQIGLYKAATEPRWLSVSEEARLRHIYVIGQTGSGKTTFLANCMFQDIEAGRGFAFVDPHGDCATKIIDAIPRCRVRDVVYFNPSDTEYPIGFNPLRGVPEHLQATATANLIATFRSIWRDFWGPRMEHILSNTLAALIACPPSQPVSLLDVPAMLTNARFRRRILRHVKDPVVQAFWEEEFESYPPRLRSEMIAPILNKMGAFARSPVMRNILGQSKSSFDLAYMMDNRKILVVSLSKGVLGEDMTNLLGSLVVCAIQQEAMKRATIPEDARVDFHLYIDEFQNFTTDAFDSIVSEARKYRLSLVIAHQYLDQISERVRRAILGNVGNMVLFSLSGRDAETLAIECQPFKPQVLREQGRGDMLVRSVETGVTREAVRARGVVPVNVYRSAGRVVRNSRTRFCCQTSANHLVADK